MGTANSLHTSA